MLQLYRTDVAHTSKMPLSQWDVSYAIAYLITKTSQSEFNCYVMSKVHIRIQDASRAVCQLTWLLVSVFSKRFSWSSDHMCLAVKTLDRYKRDSLCVLKHRPLLRNDLYCVEWGVKLYSLTPCASPRGRHWGASPPPLLRLVPPRWKFCRWNYMPQI